MLQFLLSIVDESDHDKIVYIYERFHNDMIRHARRQLFKANAADYLLKSEDVVQNAFVKISLYIKAINFSVSDKELKGYILSIVSHEVINELKDQEYFDDIDECLNVASDDDFVNDLMIQERYDEVVAAVERMDEKYRLALVYRFYKEFSIKEMAELFGVPEKTVYTRIKRAQRLLKEMLGEEK